MQEEVLNNEENLEVSETVETVETTIQESETLVAIQSSVEQIEKISLVSMCFIALVGGIVLASIIARYLKH